MYAAALQLSVPPASHGTAPQPKLAGAKRKQNIPLNIQYFLSIEELFTKENFNNFPYDKIKPLIGDYAKIRKINYKYGVIEIKESI